MARKTQLISGFTLATARADLSARAQRVARERKALAANVESIELAMDMLKAIAKKAKANVVDAYDYHAYGSIEADCYFDTDSTVYVRTAIRIKALSLDDIAWKKALGYAKLAGFEFGEEGARKVATDWSAGLEAEGRRDVNGVKAVLTMRLELKGADEGATCERVQVGVKTKTVEEPVYELRCH